MSARLYADEAGEGGAALVLLHGFGATHRVWDGVRTELGNREHVLAFDLPGHGRSLDVPGAGPARIAAEAVSAALGERRVGRFHLAGHSYGGAVAALIALERPRDVASLTLLAPGGFGREINAPLLRRFAKAESLSEIRACLGLMVGRKRAPETVVRQAAEMRAAPDQRTHLRRICSVITRDGQQGLLPLDRLAALAKPIHIGWGTLDPVLSVRQARDLPSQFAVHLLPELGHMLPVEAPREVAQMLRQAMG